MQKKIALFLILTVIFSAFAVSAFAEAAPSVTVGTASGQKGDVVQIPVVLSGNRGFASLGIEIDYNGNVLELTAVKSNNEVGASFTQAPSVGVVPFNMSWDSPSNTGFNGTLVTLSFKIISDCAGAYPVTVDYYKGRNGNYVDGDNVNYDENFVPLGLGYVNGSVTVKGENIPPVSGNPSVSVGSETGVYGDTIDVPVVLSDNKGFANLGIEIRYNANVLELTAVKPNNEVGASFTQAPSIGVVPFNMSWDSPSNTAFNGTLVTLSFKIISDCAGIYPVTVDYYKGRNGNYVDGDNVNYDENFAPLGLGYVNGSVVVGTKPQEPEEPSSYVTAGNVSGSCGDMVAVPVILSENKGFVNLGIEIGYDSDVLKLISVDQSSSVGGTFTSAPALNVNPFNMSWDSASNVNFNGTLVTMMFEIISDKEGTYPVTVDYYKGRNGNYVDGDNVNYDENFKPLNLGYENGSVTVAKKKENSIMVYDDGRVELIGEKIDGMIVLAGFIDGEMAWTQSFDANGESVSVELGDEGYIKVMWWADNLAPKCKPVIVD